MVASPTAVFLAAGLACLFALNRSDRASAGEDKQSQGSSRRPSLLDRVPAYHFRAAYYVTLGHPDFDPSYLGPPRIERPEEVWAVGGIGRRAELRREGKLLSVTVDAPRWPFMWDVERNLVVASPSRLNNPSDIGLEVSCMTRKEAIRWSKSRMATYVAEKNQLDGKEVEKTPSATSLILWTTAFCRSTSGGRTWRSCFNLLMRNFVPAPTGSIRRRTSCFAKPAAASPQSTRSGWTIPRRRAFHESYSSSRLREAQPWKSMTLSWAASYIWKAKGGRTCGSEEMPPQHL
jgi:hypothetical protein